LKLYEQGARNSMVTIPTLLYAGTPAETYVCRRVHNIANAPISFVMSIRPSAWNSTAPTGRILMKFDLFKKLRRENSSLIKVREE
jgi:hypothetical protein